MLAIKNEINFLAYCVETYKAEKGWTGQQTYNYFYQTGAANYILTSCDDLNLTGHMHILNNIDSYIKNNIISA